MDQIVLGLFRLELILIDEVPPELTVTVPVPASISPWNKVTV